MLGKIWSALKLANWQIDYSCLVHWENNAYLMCILIGFEELNLIYIKSEEMEIDKEWTI